MPRSRQGQPHDNPARSQSQERSLRISGIRYLSERRRKTMAAPQGNQFWKARTKHGRDKIFASSDMLWEACQEYFQWVEDNPLWESKLFSYQGDVTEGVMPKMRAMTIDGLCLFLDIDDDTWRAWREVDDFSVVVVKVDKIIRTQKFEGAAADQLNPNIIARDLGLADRQTVTHKVKDDGTNEW